MSNVHESIPGPSSSSSSSSTLTPALFKRLHPRPYLEKFVSEGIRPDGRLVTPSQGTDEAVWRDLSVNVGSISTAPASALVRLGNTTVVCGITLEVAPPDLATPYQGFLVPNIDLPALCSPLFRPGPPSDEAQVLSSRLRDILISSNVLPLSSLLIEPAKSAFVVYMDVVCLNYDGGVLDAAVLACVAALRELRLPEAIWDIDNLQTVCTPVTSTSPGRKLELGPMPASISFGVFGSHLLPDPTLFETQLCTSNLTIAVTLPSASMTSKAASSTSLVHLYQAGAPLIPHVGGLEGGGKHQLNLCFELVRARAHVLRGILGW
ncbi:hypothetical protein T439DRAFT_324852 [Meredithblackwellia eburnea MCA 4105]